MGGLSGDGKLFIGNTTFSVGNNNRSTQYSGEISGSGSVKKIGTGTLFLSGSSSYAGGTSIAAGTLELGVNAQSLVISGSADISGGILRVDYSGASIAATIRNRLSSHAIFSSTGTGTIGLGIADTGAAIRVTRALFGDANLDGRVNALDFNALASNFGGSGKFWMRGDFNYDSVVSTLDFNSLTANFNQVMPLSAALSVASRGVLTPEQGTLAILGAAAATLRRRRSVR